MVFKFTNSLLIAACISSSLGAMNSNTSHRAGQYQDARSIDPDEALLNAISANDRNAVLNAMGRVARRGRVVMHMAEMPHLSPEIIDDLLVNAPGDISYPPYNPKDPDSRSKRALVQAAFSGNINMAAYLIALGAGVSKSDSVGCTPLHAAASGRRPELIKLLIAHGACLNMKDMQNRTPAQLARQMGKNDACIALLENPASFDHEPYIVMVRAITESFQDSFFDEALIEFERREAEQGRSMDRFDRGNPHLYGFTQNLEEALRISLCRAESPSLYRRMLSTLKKHEDNIFYAAFGVGVCAVVVMRTLQLIEQNHRVERPI